MEQTGSFRAAVPLSVLTAVLGQCITSGSAMPARLLLLQGFPMALGIGDTNEMMSDMGVVMISGMVISTIITLLFTPVYYSVIDQLSHIFRRRKPPAEHPTPATSAAE